MDEQHRIDRAGLVTASKFEAVMKGGAARENYKLKLVFERRSRKPVHEVTAKSLAWGKDVEAYAREAFELETGLIVRTSGLVIHPKYPYIGCSPDGLIDDDAGYESKCPMDEAVHVGTILDGMPDDHVGQVQGTMFVCNLKRYYFCSYDPRACEEDRLYTQEIPRDEKYIKALEVALVQFELEIRAAVRVLENR